MIKLRVTAVPGIFKGTPISVRMCLYLAAAIMVAQWE